jgi:hypothetical protein
MCASRLLHLSSCLVGGVGRGLTRKGTYPVAPNGCGGVELSSVARPKRAGVSNMALALSIGHPIFPKVLRSAVRRQGCGGRPVHPRAPTSHLPAALRSLAVGGWPGACSCTKPTTVTVMGPPEVLLETRSRGSSPKGSGVYHIDRIWRYPRLHDTGLWRRVTSPHIKPFAHRRVSGSRLCLH